MNGRFVRQVACAALVAAAVTAPGARVRAADADAPPDCGPAATLNATRRATFGSEILAPAPGAVSLKAGAPLKSCTFRFTPDPGNPSPGQGATATITITPAATRLDFTVTATPAKRFTYGQAVGIGDAFELVFGWADPSNAAPPIPPQLDFYVDPAGVCVVLVSSAHAIGRGDPSLCSATSSVPLGESTTWTGSVTVKWDALRRAGLDPDAFYVLAVWVRPGKTGVASDPLTISTCDRLAAGMASCPLPAPAQSYVAAVGDLGHQPDVPPHRVGIAGYLPLTKDMLAGVAFSDDSGTALSTRSAAVKSLRGPFAKGYACRSCGSFQTDDVGAFAAPFTSASVLGSDLSAFGVDAPPFTMGSVSFPLDSAYKGVYAPLPSGGRIVTVGAAELNGNTKQNGYARDNVLAFSETLPIGPYRVKHTSGPGATNAAPDTYQIAELDAGFMEANGNRSVAARGSGPFATIPVPLLHSTNVQLDAAYAWQALGPGTHVLSKTARDEIPPLAALLPIRRYAVMLRYGTQDAGQGNVLDVAGSVRWQPAPVDLSTTSYFGGSSNLAAGYRVVGRNYDPIDGAFDAHAGQHGMYGQYGYTYTLDRPQGQAFSLTVSGWSFGDSRPRDQAMQVQIKVPLPVKSQAAGVFSVQLNDTFGHVAVSQAGRANGIVVPDAAGGAGLLPNDQYNLQITYAFQKRLSVTGGYTYLDAQGCSTKLVTGPQPCYAYHQPQVVGDVAWTPFPYPAGNRWASTFVEASVQGSTTMPFRTDAANVLETRQADYYETTAGHIVRTAAVGTSFVKTPTGCATLLLSTVNRGGDADQFAKSAPVPGFTNTASLEYVAGGGFPSVLVAYSRIGNVAASPPSSRLLVLRLQLGAPFTNFGRSPHGNCGS